MSAKTNKGSFLARALPSIFGFLNEKDVDQAKLAEFEKEAQAAISGNQDTELADPETLDEPEAADDDELTKLKAQVTQLENTNASLKTENTKFKSQHKAQVAAGVTLPNEDASVRNAQEAPAFASDSPMGIALSRFQK